MTATRFDVSQNATLYIPFTTYNASGASVTMTGFATSDILIYKDGSVTQRSSTAGFTLLDTDGTDFDGVTGLHGFSIDLSDNTDAGFYALGSQYWVVVSTITADTQVLTFLAAWFRIVGGDAEPGQGAPPATADFRTKIAYLYKAWRNKTTQTNSTYSLFNDDAATVDQKATVTDDGTTFTRNEIGSGP